MNTVQFAVRTMRNLSNSWWKQIPLLICFIVGCLVANLLGCATLINSSTQQVGVSTSPAGAKVWVHENDYFTPAVVPLQRDDQYILLFTKEGYEQSSMTLTRRLSPWVLGNVFLFPPLGTVIGVVVDSYTGAMWTLQPETVHVALRKDTKG